MKKWSSEKISVFALIMLITSAIDSVRNLPATALFGSSLIFFFILATLMFLIPIALVSAELASTWSEEEGGIYSWVHRAFGPYWAFFTIWLQWVNTIVWYPTIVSFIAATLAYLINPELAQSKWYILTVILTVFWTLTFLGLSGLRASARFASVCAILGMLLPIGLLIVFAIAWVAGGHPMAIHFTWDSMIPALNKTQSWVSLTAIITAFLGMELAAVHVRNIQNPQRNFPRAIFCSAILIVVTMLLGSLAIAIILPKNEIGLVQGIPQAFTYFFNYYHLSFLTPIIIFAILLSSLGSMINWIISPAKGLLMAADHGILPKWFHKLNQHGIASRVLLSQAVLVTVICGIFLLLQSINEIYWLFTVLSTELYVLMYVLMLVAAIRLKHSHGEKPRPFAVFGGKSGYYFTCGLGILGCVLALVIGFFPPEEALAINNVLHFRIIFSIGIILMLTPAGLLLWRHKAKTKD
ncbi:MAG: APC family permease [Gammaproteobacteria bacterium]|nr:APC family permease [Gammaproteobacteria bacterium]